MSESVKQILIIVSFLTGAVVAGAVASAREPNTFLIAHTEDSVAIQESFTNRGDCLVQLEKESQTNFKLTCWSKPDENIPK